MSSLGIVMTIALVAGGLTVILSTIGLVIDHRRSVAREREYRRHNASSINAKTILSYKTKLQNDADRYRRRA